VAWFGLKWHVVVKTWEEDIIIKWVVVVWLFPFLPCTSVLSTSNKDQITSLNEDTFKLKLFNLASVIKVNKDDLGSVKGNVVLEAVLVMLCLAGVVIINCISLS
jgi:hypothetical protein